MAKTTPDVYQYTSLPDSLRVQIVHILRDAIGEWEHFLDSTVNLRYRVLHQLIAREHGVFELTPNAANDAISIFNFVLNEKDVAKVLDIPEITFRSSEELARRNQYPGQTLRDIGEVIDEFNERCRRAEVGYEYRSGCIIRVDSEYVHQEAIKPALAILSESEFAGANQEFLRAHEHFRHGRYKESMNEALKAFESTIKTIASKRKWSLPKTPTARALIDACFSNQLLDPMLMSYLSGVRTSLESGLPTVRNQAAGHGQGEAPIAVPDYLAAFAINQAAVSIVMLATAHKQRPK